MKVTLCDAAAYSFYEISFPVNGMFTNPHRVVAKLNIYGSPNHRPKDAELADPHRVRICGNRPSLLVKTAKITKYLLIFIKILIKSAFPLLANAYGLHGEQLCIHLLPVNPF
ncbi:hypothetical protein [Pectobacterium brasiliense]|uniref:hypothetical protein n=1 Tax=Pectobacterium brasiliense TaxID=180957 RepID=UPI001038DE2F|nr:hypothetical protein [Pectobacterium brasiliense]